jgi:hypothetical protein
MISPPYYSTLNVPADKPVGDGDLAVLALPADPHLEAGLAIKNPPKKNKKKHLKKPLKLFF